MHVLHLLKAYLKKVSGNFAQALEKCNNATFFTTVMRGNDCTPVCCSPVLATQNVATSHPVLAAQDVATSSPVLSTQDVATTSTSHTPTEALWERLKVTREKAAELEESTREQSNSSQWYEERRIRITSSFFGRVCRRLPTTCQVL